jgi:hypothetical protein
LAARLTGRLMDEFFIDDAMTSLRREHSATAALVALFSQTGLRLREDADWLVLELPMPTEQLASEEAHGAYR